MGYCLTTVKQSQGFSVAKHHCLANNNSQLNLFVWDPTESVATRPLFMLSNPGSYKFFYTFDGNKNVSELVHFETRNGIAAHYDYTPFGAITRAVTTSAISARNFHFKNPFRFPSPNGLGRIFSSEYHDDTLGVVYYNYRHYNPIDGRWLQFDFFEDDFLNTYLFIANRVIGRLDYLGLVVVIKYVTANDKKTIKLPKGGSDADFIAMLNLIKQENGKICYIRCGGHGSQNRIWINGEWDYFGILATENDKTLKIKTNRSGSSLLLIQNKSLEPAEITDITPLLIELLREGATIDFNSCLSVRGDCNIAKSTSLNFKDVKVRGSRKYAAFGIEEPHVRWPKVYMNGVEQ